MVSESSSNSATNLIIGLLVFLALAFLLFYFGLPLLRTAGGTVRAPQQINNYAPPQGNQAPQVNIPDKVNVDINSNPGEIAAMHRHRRNN